MYSKYAILRDERGYNDHQVATATGIPQSTIYDWKQRSERDANAKISIDNLVKITRLFGVPMEAFLEEVTI